MDKTYIPPGRVTSMKLFENPSSEEYLFIIFYWTILFIMIQPYLIPKPIFDLIIYGMGSYDGIYNIVFAIVCVNSALALAVLYTCMSAEFPLIVSLKWTGLTLFFGFMTASKAMKIAFKRKSQLEAEDDIG